MGMGYGANYADTIDVEELKKIAPQEWKALEESVDGHHEDLIDEVLYEIACGDEVHEEIQNAYERFQDYIYGQSGMMVEVGYHNSEDHGDRYDEVEGVFWHVDNAYIPNPKIDKRFTHMIDRNFYVTYG